MAKRAYKEAIKKPSKKNIKQEVVSEKSNTKSNTYEDKVNSDEPPVNQEVKDNNEIDPQQLLDEFTKNVESLDKIVSEAKNETELNEILDSEYKKAEDAERQLTDKIKNMESKLSEQQKKAMDNLNNRTNFWGGVSCGWFTR